MRDTASGPRVLLKRLRELMQEPLEPQERLDRIVRDIASNMVAEVCSLYVLRADSVLEDRTRRLSARERTNHMLLMLNTGAYMAFFALQVAGRWGSPDAIVPARHPPLLAWLLTACAVAVLVWAVRDALAAQRQAARPARAAAATPRAAR